MTCRPWRRHFILLGWPRLVAAHDPRVLRRLGDKGTVDIGACFAGPARNPLDAIGFLCETLTFRHYTDVSPAGNPKDQFA